ncbi:unnamed protein product [Rhizophagus irregularis]|nr:unnamed protein product [Rhizophagus irregularis]
MVCAGKRDIDRRKFIDIDEKLAPNTIKVFWKRSWSMTTKVLVVGVRGRRHKIRLYIISFPTTLTTSLPDDALATTPPLRSQRFGGRTRT